MRSQALILTVIGLIAGAGCTHQAPLVSARESAIPRAPAADPACEEFNARPALEKIDILFQKHLESALPHGHVRPAELAEGGEGTRRFVADFLSGAFNRTHQFVDAAAATTTFLVPGEHENAGYRRLHHVIARSCDVLEKPQVKMVHALGTMARAHLKVYDRLTQLSADGRFAGEIANPWTGLLSAEGTDGTVPMLVRFSIANPVGLPIKAGKKSLSLEFIPGLGLKFLIDGRKSVDLLAMESLAGQGDDQNFFKYEFSPDFSAHAPPDFNTATGEARTDILARYARNPVNRDVMNLVGKRFTQVIPYATGIPAEDLHPHSNVGPHGFIISIQKLAATDRLGREVPLVSQKRPWRLVFRPALDALPQARRGLIVSSEPYHMSASGRSLPRDFRFKLANLQPRDVIYFVEGETQAGARYRLGEIVLDSAPFPSPFADREFFIQHDIEMNRQVRRDGVVSVVDPEPAP